MLIVELLLLVAAVLMLVFAAVARSYPYRDSVAYLGLASYVLFVLVTFIAGNFHG